MLIYQKKLNSCVSDAFFNKILSQYRYSEALLFFKQDTGFKRNNEKQTQKIFFTIDFFYSDLDIGG